MTRSTTMLLTLALSVPLVAQQQPPTPELAWVDRDGTVQKIGRLPSGAFGPRLSPDGKQVAFDADGAIWIADLDKIASPRRIGPGRFPMWSADGTRLLFAGPHGFQLYWQVLDGGAPEMIAASASAGALVDGRWNRDVHHAEGRSRLRHLGLLTHRSFASSHRRSAHVGANEQAAVA